MKKKNGCRKRLEGKEVKLHERFLAQVKKSGVVILAGAGVSAVPPSCLPNWISLNKMIASALCERVETYMGRYDENGKPRGKLAYVANRIRELVLTRLEQEFFPPDYQAQILEETCGDYYFKALQSLDVNMVNSVHSIIAWLAKKGAITAIVTTNFDCLLERALEKEEVPFEVAYDKGTYETFFDRLEINRSMSPLPLLKVHGSVIDSGSMVDTLKQRLLGRNESLNKCLELFLKNYFWILTGFSARDLETDASYLQFATCAQQSPGIVYVQWPGQKELSEGARQLLKLYSGKSHLIIQELEPFFLSLCKSLNLSEPPSSEKPALVDSTVQVRNNLKKWANELHIAAAVNCLAGIGEANGIVEETFMLLHRFWKDVDPRDREGADFEVFRFNHGRLGMGYGQLSLVEDFQSTAGEESLQNLLRTHKKDPRAQAWIGLTFLWAGRIGEAIPYLERAKKALREMLLSAEMQTDIWLALQEERYLLLMPETVEEVQDFIREWFFINKLAAKAGDLPRQVKSTVLASLILAEYPNFYKVFVQEKAQPILSRAERLNDPGISGFHNLAEGRYYSKKQNGKAAQTALQKACVELKKNGRPPWIIFAQIELIKAYLDQARDATVDNSWWDELNRMANEINQVIDRYQVFLPWFEEARGQIYACSNQPDRAREAFEKAIAYAHRLGLKSKENLLKKYLV